MDKILKLGGYIEETGEPRVSLFDESLIKTASNDIQDFWVKLDKSTDKAYLHVIAMTAGEFYGPNNNGDFFHEADLKKYHKGFISDAYIYLHHVNKDPKKSMGRPIYSYYNENMHRVELILEIDKSSPLAEKVLKAIKDGEEIYVSMGVRVTHDICSICGNKAKTRKAYCPHLRYNMKRILPDGRQVYSINPAPLKFFDISIVSKPADRVAWALEKAASNGYVGSADALSEEQTSAYLGEQDELQKLAQRGLDKFSEIIKYVDGDISGLKEVDDKNSQTLEVLRGLGGEKLKSINYPDVLTEELLGKGLSPGGAIRAIVSMGAPPSLRDMIIASGRHHMGGEFSMDMIPLVMHLLPKMLPFMKRAPGQIWGRGCDIINDYSNELEDKGFRQQVMRMAYPGITARITLVKTAVDNEDLEKVAATLGAVAAPVDRASRLDIASPGLMSGLNVMYHRDRERHGVGNLHELTVTGQDGEVYKTNMRAVYEAHQAQSVPRSVAQIVGTALGAASLGALFGDTEMLTKLLAAPGGLMAYKMLTTKPNTVTTHEGVEIPSNTTLTKVLSKTAGLTPRQYSLAKDAWPVMGMAVPGLLGLDYLYNSKVKYRNDPISLQNLTGVGKAMNAAGKFVVDHPALSMGIGGLGGAIYKSHRTHLKNKV